MSTSTYVGYLVTLETIADILRINVEEACEEQKTRHSTPAWMDINFEKKRNPNFEYNPDKERLLEDYIDWYLRENGCETAKYITDKGSYIFGIKLRHVGTVYMNYFISVSTFMGMVEESRDKFLEEMRRLNADLSSVRLQPIEWSIRKPIIVENPEPFVFNW
jgi:hypothetical protein